MSRLSLAFVVLALPAFADEATDKLAKELRDYATAELAKVPGKDGKFSTVLPDYLREQIKQANKRDREAWSKINSKEDWEKFRDERIKALRESLGTWPDVPKNIPVRVTKTIEAADYRIDNVLYESRSGVWVDGNLYYPAKPQAKMPVILIAHSHHAPKHQGELQDMGVLWAKAGCMVLVIDQLGHGERRQHPFVDAKSYPKEFRVGRQDYYFRYNLNLQLSLVGDSLMGWQAWDLMRGLDLCLARPGADKDRVILLGAVAAGGDLAAVTAALDPRFKCVVPFNFGGPQPETRFPLPEDVEERFNYVGSGSWESTRNLRDSARDGFLPWVIVASVAPRKMIHAHEFAWDGDRDPVWKRYQKIWGFYDATDSTGAMHGSGSVSGQPPEATHCTNIGPIHRKAIYPYLKKWFDIAPPEKEPNERRSAEELRCWTEEAVKELKPRPLHQVLAAIAEKQIDEARTRIYQLGEKDRGLSVFHRIRLQLQLPVVDHSGVTDRRQVAVSEYCDAIWATYGGTEFRFQGLVLKPKSATRDARVPGVVCVCDAGPNVFLREHAEAISILIQSGMSVALPELCGTGSERPGNDRGRTSYSTSLSATSQMVGSSVMSRRFGDLGLSYDRGTSAGYMDERRVAIWGESPVGPIQADKAVAVPADLDQPRPLEPFAAAMVGLLGLDHKDLKAVVARGGLVSYRSVLDSPFVHVPHDALPINVFRAGDLPDVWAALAPKPLRLESLVDGTNRRVTGENLQQALKPVSEAYKKGGLVVKEEYSSDAEIAKWIIEQLKK
jgi:dienelactone hydrolase